MANNHTDHLDPTVEITLDTVKKRAVKGVVVLTGRTFLLSVLSLIATGLLTYFLAPSEFGVFWIVSAVVNFLAYFSDIGLAAALIQKKQTPTQQDFRTTFTVQQILVFLLIVLLIILTPVFLDFYDLTRQGQILLYALGLSLFMSSLKTIPSIILERKLEFGKLVIPQILENLTYNFVAVILAWQGFGVLSFAYAVVARGVVGLVSMYILQPWLPGFALAKDSLRSLLSFGVPYQANTLLATLKDDGMTAVLGGILGPTGIGFLGWAQKWGQAPLRFFMDHVIKVTFPAFSRMQDEAAHLRRSVERSIFFICFLVFPSLVGLLILAPVLVDIIPRYEKWTPALLPLYLIGINTVFASVTTQLTNLLNATGRIKTTFKLMVMWTTLSWIFLPLMSIRWGVVGAAGGYALVGSSSLIAIFLVRRIVYFSLKDSVLNPFLATCIMGAAIFALRQILPSSLSTVFIIVTTGLVVYSLTTYLLIGKTIVGDVKKSISALITK